MKISTKATKEHYSPAVSGPSKLIAHLKGMPSGIFALSGVIWKNKP
jgi:hypothetical protein